MAKISSKAAQDAFDRGGITALADLLYGTAETATFEQLLTVSADPQKVAADNFARGVFTAYREITEILKALK